MKRHSPAAAGALLACGLCAGAGTAAALPLIRAPEAPFVEKPVELETPAPVLKTDRIEAGTKELVWYSLDDNLAVVANGRTMACYQTRVKPTCPAWQPIRRFDVTAGPDAVTRVSHFGLTEDAGGDFVQRFRVEGDRAVWDSQYVATGGVAVAEQTMTICLPRDAIKGRIVRVRSRQGREQILRAPTDADWDDRKDPKAQLWAGAGHFRDPAEVVVDAEHPEYSFTLRFGPNVLEYFNVYRSLQGLELYLSFRREAVGRPFRQEVVFGRAAKRAAGDCVVNGLNFTQSSGLEVPRWGRRNMLNNPSFESDMRYWQGVSSSAMIDNQLVRDAHSGRWACRLGGSQAFAVPTKANTRLTFSCWAKSVNGRGGDVSIGAWGYTGTGNFGNRHLYLKAGRDWQRLSCSFDWPHRGIALSIMSWDDKNVIVDDLQLEEGDRATDFEGPPYAVVLRTDSPDRYYGDADRVFNPRLVVRGAPGARNVAKIRVNDFFGRVTWTGSVPFEIGADGEAVVPACPEEAVAAKGVNVIRVEIDTGDGRSLVDHLRVVRYRYAKGDEPNAELHQVEALGWQTRHEADIDPVNWHRVRSQGLDVFARDLYDYWGFFDAPTRFKIAEWYRAHGGRIKQEVFTGRTLCRGKLAHPMWQFLIEEGIPQENLPETTKGYGEKELAAVERAAERLARENPWCTDWIGTSELGVNWHLTRTHNYREYAKIIMAAHRGIKRGNPQATFIAHGTCNAGQQGRAELHEFMEATKAIDPKWAWDGLQVHPYRPFPEFPSLESDLKLLFADMARHNMPTGLVYADEGAYFKPLLVKEWGAAPWAGTGEKDTYGFLHATGYDLGWAERVSTAMLLRYNLQCYRFVPRIRYVTSWNIRTLDTYTPWAVYLGTAAETELLGHAAYAKDVRFGDGARAYFFDDRKGHAVAAIWKFNVALDKGLEKASEMTMDAQTLDDCEIFDLLANRCRAEGGRLPLSNYPVYLRVPLARMDALVRAVETCTTTDDGHGKKIYDPAPVAIPHCGEKPDWSSVAPVKLATVEVEEPARHAGQKWGGEKDFSGECRIAWNGKGLFFKVDVKDDKFVLDRSTYRYGESQWYACEGVQIFFDTLGDARDNLRLEMTGFDDNDLSYELLPSSESAAIVFRRLAPDIQQTGGVSDPLKSNVVVPEITCAFRWDAAKGLRTYEVFFPARQLMPMQLKAGSKIGCSLTVFDRDAPGQSAKQTATDIPAGLGGAYQHPEIYTPFVLVP